MASPSSARLRLNRGGQGEAQWKQFEQRRHRMKPPDLFDESLAKYEKYDHFVASAQSELASAKVRLANGHPGWQGFDPPAEEGEQGSDCPEEVLDDASPLNTDLGVRKAQFFDRCLRADRSVEYPRRPALPPVKISSFRAEVKVPNSPKAPWHRASTNESQEPKRSSSIGAAGADEAKAKLSRFDNSMLDLVNQCRRVRLHPATTGLVRPEPGKLKLEYGFLTDERAEAITDSLKATASEVREAHFRSNGLSATGARQLLEALPAELECVDLSQNDLSNDVGWCLAFRQLTKLNSLTLSDCQLADNACVELLNNLIRCKSLTRIDLSRNVISSGSAFQPLLKRFSQLEELDVHWNHFGGEASALLQGIIECHHGGLRSLNLSWNPLGKFSAEENCHQLVRLFRETKTLRHLDLSRCDLTMAHCKILAEGLEDNRTLVGLHVSGNEAHVDAQGFLVPRRNSPPGEGDPHATMSLADDEDSCCWVCQRWRETKLRYTPGISGPDASDVWAYTSIDGFTKPIRMQREGEDFVTYVMAAPGPLRFVFQADRHPIACSRTAPQVELREMIAALRGGLGCYQRTNLVPEDGDNGVVLKLRAKQPDDEADRLVEVISFSTIQVVERPEDESVCDHYIPRKLGEFKPSSEPEDWCLESSLFAPHWEPLSGKQFRDRCFEVDWHTSHLTSLLPEEGETIAIRDLLREHYAEMKVLFSSLCSVDWFALQRGRALSFGMGLYQYTHMLVQHNLVGQDLSLEEADAIFVAAGLPAKDTSKYLEAYRIEGRLIQRHGFFGLLVRLAIRFARGNSARGLKGRFNHNKTEQVKKALQYIFAKHLMYPYAPMKNNLRCVQWRESVLHTQTVEGVFRKHMQAVVDPLFKTFSEGRAFLTPEEWFRMLDCMEIFPCSGTDLDSDSQQMNAWDRVWAWQVSAMTQVEELAHVRSLHLLFVEFLEALARLVGLLHSRKFCENHLEDENGERWDYGMPHASPVSIFCLEPAVTDMEGFAELLDGFFAGPIPAKALSA